MRIVAAAALLVLVAGVAIFALIDPGESDFRRAGVVRADAVGVIDLETPTLEAEVATGPSPAHLAARGAQVWVSNADGRSISRIDRQSRAVRQTVAVGGGPAGIALSGGAAWVANSADGTVSRVSLDTNAVVQRITVGSHPTGLAADERTVWVANSGERSVWGIDSATGRVRTRIDIAANPTDLALGAGALWVTSARGRSVSRIDPAAGQVVQAIGVGGGASGLAVGGGAVWVANGTDGTVSRIDAASGRVVATIPLGNGPRAIALGGGGVWVTEQFAGTVARIDPRANAVAQRIRVGNRPTAVAMLDGALWVGVRASGAAHRGGTLRVVTTRPKPDFLDPVLAYDVLSVPLLGMTNDGLTAFAQVGGPDGGQVVPDLAVSLPAPTDDGRVYRFVLRPGIRYSTGAVVRARDVRASFERMFRTAGSTGHDFFRAIVGARRCVRLPSACDLSKGIRVGPGATVTFHLTAPDAEFLEKLALTSAYILPAGTPVRARGTVPYRRLAHTRSPATGPAARFGWHGTRISMSGHRPRCPTGSPTPSPIASTSSLTRRST